MFDGAIRPKLDPFLKRVAKALVTAGFSANAVTVLGLVIGLVAAGAIWLQLYWLALALILISRVCDGLDGAVARLTKKTDYGGYLDIVLDFAFYGAIPLGFVLADPAANAVAGAVLIFSFYVNGASFLAFAIMAEKHNLTTDQRGEKSFFFSTGLAEATETIVVFVLFCLFPTWFPIIAYLFAAIVFYTALSRIIMTRKALAST
ncbi:MAG: CDP-alcohol phosphatidyltransferase family protein [Pseudomonadota bacterium]